MEGLYKKFPVLLGIEEKDAQMVLQTAFLTSIVYYDKGIKLPPNTKLPSGSALKDCQKNAGQSLTTYLTLASVQYTLGMVGCSKYTIPWAIGACLLANTAIYAAEVYGIYNNYETAMELCQYKYGR